MRAIKFVRSVGVLFVAFALGVLLVWLVAPPRVLVRWETASEVDTLGFFVLRAESPDGPFVPLNETLVAAQGDPLTGASYQFEDCAVVWGRVYFYQLEELERGGDRNRYPEVVRAQAGAGWGGALAVGAALAALVGGGTVLLSWRRKGRESPW